MGEEVTQPKLPKKAFNRFVGEVKSQTGIEYKGNKTEFFRKARELVKKSE